MPKKEMIPMTNEEVEQGLSQARRTDGSFDGLVIAEMYKRGVRFQFLNSGVRWTFTDNSEEKE